MWEVLVPSRDTLRQGCQGWALGGWVLLLLNGLDPATPLPGPSPLIGFRAGHDGLLP